MSDTPVAKTFSTFRTAVALCLLGLMSFGCSVTSKAQIEKIDGSSISSSELTDKIESLISAAKVSGLSVVIFNENKPVYQKAFGYSNVEKKEVLTTENVFSGASLSKAVFAYLVAQLATEGTIDLDKPLQDYLEKPLPDYQFENERRSYHALKDDSRYEKITARMCLSHTTGFPNWRWLTRESDFSPEGEIRFLVDPGVRYYYSGEGIQLLQFVIEQITGKGLEDLAQEKIFQPMKMEMTSYVARTKFEHKYCNGHSTEEKALKKNTTKTAIAAGSIQTTIEDYSTFIQHILQLIDDQSPITKLLFEPNIRIQSTTQFGYQAWIDTDENDSIELNYGLGWGLLKSPFGMGMFKEGHDEGFQHYSILFPEKNIGIVILSNSDNAESIFKELLETSIGDTYTPWKWERYIPYDNE